LRDFLKASKPETHQRPLGESPLPKNIANFCAGEATEFLQSREDLKGVSMFARFIKASKPETHQRPLGESPLPST